MTARRALALALVVVTALVLYAPVGGTDAVSSTTLTRDVAVDVVDGTAAVVGVAGHDVEVPADGTETATVQVAEVRNNLDRTVTVTARVDEERPNRHPVIEDVEVRADPTSNAAYLDKPTRHGLSPDDTGVVMAEVRCGGHAGNETVTVTTHAYDEATSIRTEVTITVVCR